MNRKFLIENLERKRIQNLYQIKSRDYVFEACLSINGRYLVFQDEVLDLVENKNLGNLFDSFDTIKTVLLNCESDDKDYMSLRESIINLPIIESEVSSKDLKRILMEDFWSDTWLGKSLSDAGKGISDTYQQAKSGLEKLGTSISQGKWSDVLNMFGKGILFVLRKLKEALFSNVGMIVDGILFAVSGGTFKALQWIPWALVVALDLYQMITGDYATQQEASEPMWAKALGFGFDVLGLVATASSAKIAKIAAKPLLDAAVDSEQAIKVVEKTPGLKSTIQNMINGLKSVPKYLGDTVTYLQKTSPKTANFISSIFGGMSKFLNEIESSLGELVGQKFSKGAMAGAKTGTVVYGIDKTVKPLISKLAGSNQTELNSIQQKNLETLSSIKSYYGGRDPFAN